MTTLLTILGLSLLASLLLTPVARALARRCGLVDHPDGRRKIHARETPVAGGLALFVAATCAVGVGWAVPNPLQSHLIAHSQTLLGLLGAAAIICVVGVIDDYGKLRGRHKLLGQILAALVVIASGVTVRNVRFFDWHVELGLLAIPFTLLWLLGAINSLNLIDGMDGLLSSVGLIILVGLTAMATIGGQWTAACVAVALAGALLGFLRYNFPPASIFLGDSGSMLIGLVVGSLAIQSALKGPATVALAAPLAVLTIPFFDTLAAIIRRKLTGRSIYTTDRGHMHHCLLRRGLSNRRALLAIAAFCSLTVLGALASVALQNELLAVLTTLIIVGIMIISRLFGYAEFLLIKERLAALAVSFMYRGDHGRTHQTAVRLQGTADWQALWQQLAACAEQLPLKSLRLDVNAPFLHEGYHASWDRIAASVEENTLWRAELPLTATNGQLVGRLEMVGFPSQEPIWAQMAALLRVVEEFDTPLGQIAEMPKRPFERLGQAQYLPTNG